MSFRHRVSLVGLTVLTLAGFCASCVGRSSIAAEAGGLERSALVRPKQATQDLLAREKRTGAAAVVLMLQDDDSPDEAQAAMSRIEQAGLRSGVWIEIGRCPSLAKAHPEWLASLQGHPEWRRRFPKAPQPKAGEVVKCSPWVPILFREAYEAHLERVRRLLKGLPRPQALYLNDLQGPPSACGCGNDLCRWTADYGPIRTATDAGPDAAARFVAAIRQEATGVEVIPVWTSECEEAEGGKSGHCAGVSCFPGRCWRDFTQQLMPLAKSSPRIGVLATAGTFGRSPAWVDESLRSFQKMPPLRGGEAIAMDRLEPVLQAWDLSPERRRKQIERCRALGVRRCVEALTRIEQDWAPQLYRVPNPAR